MTAGLFEGRRSEAIMCLTLSGRRNDSWVYVHTILSGRLFPNWMAHRAVYLGVSPVRNLRIASGTLDRLHGNFGPLVSISLCMQACWPQTPLRQCSDDRSHEICCSPCFHAFRPVILWPNPPWVRPRSIQSSLEICKLLKQQLCSQVRSK